MNNFDSVVALEHHPIWHSILYALHLADDIQTTIEMHIHACLTAIFYSVPATHWSVKDVTTCYKQISRTVVKVICIHLKSLRKYKLITALIYPRISKTARIILISAHDKNLSNCVKVRIALGPRMGHFLRAGSHISLLNPQHILIQSNLDIKTTFGLRPKWSLW